MRKRTTLKQRIKQREDEIFQQLLKELHIEAPIKEPDTAPTFSLDTNIPIFTGIEGKLIDLATDLKKQGKMDQCKKIIKVLEDKYKTKVTLLGGEKIR